MLTLLVVFGLSACVNSSPSTSLPETAHKSAGIACSENKDFDCAIKEFRKGLDLEPGDAKGWNNLGVALMRKYAALQDQERLDDALEAFQTSVILVDDQKTKKNWDSLVAYMKKKGMKVPASLDEAITAQAHKKEKKGAKTHTASPEGETVSSGSVDKNTDKMEKRFNEGEYKKALKGCKPSLLTVQLSQREIEQKKLNLDTLVTITRILKVCGVVVIKDTITQNTLSKALTKQKASFSSYIRAIGEDVSKTNTTEANQRSPNRYELRLPMKQPYISSEIIQNVFLSPVLKSSLGSRYEIDTFSSVTSLPDAPDQHWHQDTSSLFAGSGHHTPPHGLVAFIPLVDVTTTMGPTEYMIGSHIACEDSAKVQRHTKSGWVLRFCPFVPESPEFLPELEVGSIALFDVRILHRGTKNSSDKKRPMLYISFFREWYTDRVNFKDKQTKKFDTLTALEKKLLSRVDSHEYITKLEEKLAGLGVDVEQLQSNYEYSKYSLQ